MPKRHVCDFIGLCGAILEDCAAQYPTLHTGLERDYFRLKTLYSIIGDRLFLVDLPALGARLDSALSSGILLVTRGQPLTRSVNTRTKIPRLFQGLWSMLFERNGCLKQDIDPHFLKLFRTILVCFKKYEVECAPEYKFKTIQEFYDVEAQLPPAPSLWDGDGSDVDLFPLGTLCDREGESGIRGSLFGNEQVSSDASLLALVQRVADRVSGHLGEYIPSEHRFRHGPGAVSDLHAATEFKYEFPAWSRRLQHVFPPDLFAFANTSVLGDKHARLDALLPSVEGASRMIAVPKTAKGPRLIAAEPTAHQWCQQSVKAFLDERVRATYLGASIDYRRQSLSGEDARVASHSGLRATLDLKSASDRLSCWLVQRLFRKNYSVLSALIACRTRWITNELDAKQEKLHKLRKFASMGSALTFPIQSIVFYMICLAAGASLSGKSIDKIDDSELEQLGSEVRVYGDDLIIPVTWVARTRYILERLYLRVNVDKSFFHGKFRESCGTDAFDGHVVTPVRVRGMYDESKPSSLVACVDTANNFFRSGMWKAAKWLTSAIPQSVRKDIPVVHVSSGSFGLVSFVGAVPTSRKRWNAQLQIVENMAVCLTSKVTKSRHESFANLHQFFMESRPPSNTGVVTYGTGGPEPLSFWESGRVGKPTGKLARRWVPLSYQVSNLVGGERRR